MNNIENTIFILLVSVLLVSCDKKKTHSAFDYGTVLILNQGGFNKGEASLSVYNPESHTVSNNVFINRNGRPLGDILQSAERIHNHLYLVVNNSHKIEVVDPVDFGSIVTISFPEPVSPRYIAAVSDSLAYITTFSDYVYVINTKNHSITDSIFIGVRTEGISVVDDRAYVSNTFYEDFSPGNTITVINTTTHDILKTLETGVSPGQITSSVNGLVYVANAGDFGLDNGSITIIDSESETVLNSIPINGFVGAIALNAKNNRLYIVAAGVKSYNTSSGDLSDMLPAGNYYGLGTHEDEVYVTDPLNFSQSGIIYRINTNGEHIDTFKTGIIPGGFYFIK